MRKRGRRGTASHPWSTLGREHRLTECPFVAGDWSRGVPQRWRMGVRTQKQYGPYQGMRGQSPAFELFRHRAYMDRPITLFRGPSPDRDGGKLLKAKVVNYVHVTITAYLSTYPDEHIPATASSSLYSSRLFRIKGKQVMAYARRP